MKNRIVYPELWEDTDFNACALESKLLFCYLINNILLGLTRISHINDRRIMFDTGLNVNQLATGKKELGDRLHWILFYKDWQYHNHNCAYMDYHGQPKVMLAKDRETSSIPQDVKDYFKGLVTTYQGVSNLPKSESESISESKSESVSDFHETFKRNKGKLLEKIGKQATSFILIASSLLLLTKSVDAYTIKARYIINAPKLTTRSHKLISPTPMPAKDGTGVKPAPGGQENHRLTALERIPDDQEWQIFQKYKYKAILAQIYEGESTFGQFDVCRKIGKFNGFGWNESETRLRTVGPVCYDSLDQVLTEIEEQFIKPNLHMGLDKMSCYYIKGWETDVCNTSYKFGGIERGE